MPALPQNFGSWFLVLCLLLGAGVSASVLAAACDRLGIAPRTGRRLAMGLGALLLACTPLPLRYSAPVLLFLVPLGLWLGAVWWIASWGPERPPRRVWSAVTICLALCMVPVLWISLTAASGVDALRGLALDDVKSITCESLDKPGEPVVIAKDTDLAEVLVALKDTVPYEPDHETFTNGYRVTIQTRNGPLGFVMYRGRDGCPDTAVLRLGREDGRGKISLGTYENEGLFGLLVTRYRFPAWFPD